MDIEDLYRLLRNSHMQAQGIVDNLDVPVAVLDERFYVLNVNHAFCETFRTKRDETIGKALFDLGNGQWNVPDLVVLLAAVIPKATAVVGYQITHDFPMLGERTMLVSARRIRGPASFIMVQFEDATEKKRAEAARDILLAETRHRAHNLIALARALATQTETAGRSAVEYRDAFLGRFEALLKAQDLSENAATDLAALVARILTPVDPTRIRVVAGPPAALTSAQVLPIAMILHELVTNAIKYGALSVKTGAVELAWHVDTTANMLLVHWREDGGPPVTPPSRRGFGSRLVEFSAAKDLRGTADLRFKPEGLQVTLSVPLA